MYISIFTGPFPQSIHNVRALLSTYNTVFTLGSVLVLYVTVWNSVNWNRAHYPLTQTQLLLVLVTLDSCIWHAFIRNVVQHKKAQGALLALRIKPVL